MNVNAPSRKILCLSAAAAALVMPTTGRSHPSLDVLARKIDQLGDECPWTAAQRPEDMLFHLRSEIMETEAALREKSVDAEALTKELGDVLFCALLLARVCEREHGASLPAVADAAVAKLRRRAPYVFGGPPATTLEEAERQWLDGKAAEKAVEAPAPTPAPAPAPAPPKNLNRLIGPRGPGQPNSCATLVMLLLIPWFCFMMPPIIGVCAFKSNDS